MSDEKIMLRKTKNFTFRLSSPVLVALRDAASKDNRTVSNLLEVLIREHCAKAGIKIHEESNIRK